MSTQTRKPAARRKPPTLRARAAAPPPPPEPVVPAFSPGFAVRMFEGAVHEAAGGSKSPLQVAFALGRAWAWAEVSEELQEASLVYQRRITAIVVQLHRLGMKPLPAELPNVLRQSDNAILQVGQVGKLAVVERIHHK